MLKYNELKVGDIVMVSYDGHLKEGEITELNYEQKQVCVLTSDDQEFWYDTSALQPIALDEAQLFKLGFTKQPNGDGTIKYSKGAFRVLIHHPDDFSSFEMWYREDQRHLKQPICVHDFQNKYLEMTKVHLTKGD